MIIKIELLKKSDLDECANIIFEEFNKQGEGFSKKTALQRTEGSFVPGLALCVKKGKKIIGLVLASSFHYAKGEYIWVDELVVREEFQKTGIGKQLMVELEKIAKGKKMSALGLNTRQLNFKFYENLGFEKTDYFYVEKDLRK